MSWTSEQLSELRAYAAEHRVVDSDCAKSLIAEVERLRAERQWQPMDKCPLDTWVLVWCFNYKKPRIAKRRYDEWQAMDDLVDDVEPTHWMPLPKPPEQKA